MSIQRIAVVGGGFMGGGIAQCAAQGGYDVTLVDLKQEALDKALADMRDSLGRLCGKGIVKEPAEAVLARISTSTELEAVAGVDAVIEAVFERIPVKQDVLGKIDALLPAGGLIASNTSTIPITMLAGFTSRPESFVGMHFFSPVPVNPLLEIIPGAATSPDALAQAEELGVRFGKRNFVVKKDVPGFIMNRVFGAMTCEAMRLVESGVGTVEDVDGGMTTGYGMTLGPLAIADLAGLDVCLMAFGNIAELDPDGPIQPPEILKQRVAAGKFGRKSGEGFWKYDARGKATGPAV
ncbi:MAG: 3-hydroxybutyryl-CoA dehydrogenase [Candidatus Hydrogenedens sp.]|nr:3-hydroxybutyryl-CoA dehydrogenase [Candidatus Hydrogenedens sp.]